jgi:phosphoserine phosphatase
VLLFSSGYVVNMFMFMFMFDFDSDVVELSCWLALARIWTLSERILTHAEDTCLHQYPKKKENVPFLPSIAVKSRIDGVV